MDARIVGGDVEMVVGFEIFEHLLIRRGKTEYAIPLALARVLASKAVAVIAEHDARARQDNVVSICSACAKRCPTVIAVGTAV